MSLIEEPLLSKPCQDLLKEFEETTHMDRIILIEPLTDQKVTVNTEAENNSPAKERD